MLAAALCFWLLPPVLLLVTGGTEAWVSAAVTASALSLVFWGLICFGMGIPPWYALGYPLGAAMALYIVARSTWRGRRRVEWRGRVYGDSVGGG
jgi:hypothetical protein